MEINEEAAIGTFDVEAPVEMFEVFETQCQWGCHSVQQQANNELLPIDFQVYVNNNVVINRPAPGFQARTLPTFNHYTGPNGGYLAIYTREEKDGVYSVGGGIYVVGQVRVPGQYQGRIFVPEGYQLGDNCTQDTALLKICDQYLPEMNGKIWVGGDTGCWFGIQS